MLRPNSMLVCVTAFCFLSFCSSSARAVDKPVELDVGSNAPVFSGTDDLGKAWKSAKFVGKNLVVVYFYPADFTTGCTRQAKSWRDNMNELVKKGVKVVGISGDSVANHKLFKKAWQLNFTLLADEKGAIAKKFGVPVRRGGKVRPRGSDRKLILNKEGKPFRLVRQSTFARRTFVIGKDGKIVYQNKKVKPAKDSQQVLKFVSSLSKKKPQ